MCTAITFQTQNHYFGRNLDLEYHYDETVTVTPRNFKLHLRKAEPLQQHHAMIGMATVVQGYPLYYDATNEHGLSMAGLNFPGNATYRSENKELNNITPFEFIPWILGKCRNVFEAEKLIHKCNLIDVPFNQEYPLTPLHWIISDYQRCITVEPLPIGIRIWENPIGVLTNNPPFDFHLYNLTHYLNLSSSDVPRKFADTLSFEQYSRGMGAIGLPGDLSSASRFVRAAFVKMNSKCNFDEKNSVNQFFHILSSVEQQEGCCRTESGLEKTIYSSCCNMERGIYYYTTYYNKQITAIDMHKTDISGSALTNYDIKWIGDILYVN